MIKEAKIEYLNRVKKKFIESNDTKGYFQAAKILSSATVDAPERWRIQSMFPGETDFAIAEESAEYFNTISQEFQPLEALTDPRDLSYMCPELYEVASRLKTMKKPKSAVR